jgi:hypothetical protein
MRARSWVVAIGLAAIALAARDRAPALERRWDAPSPHYDYLEAIHFARDGVGNMVWGFHQAVRCDIDFRWRQVDARTIELHYVREPVPPRRLAFATDWGRFDVIDPGPVDDRTIHYRCRLTFGATPFPAGCDTQRVFYGCAE